MTKLIEREHSMRMDGQGAVAIELYGRLGDSEKARKHKDFLNGLSSTVFAPDRGMSFEKPIEVLFVDEEYTVFTAMKLKLKSRRSASTTDITSTFSRRTPKGASRTARALLQHRHAHEFYDKVVRENREGPAQEEITRLTRSHAP